MSDDASRETEDDAGDRNDDGSGEVPEESTERSRFLRLSERPRRILRFLRLLAQKAVDDEIPTQSAALAYVTLVAIVPLLAALSYFSAGFFTDRQDELVRLLATVLPYTEGAITENIATFLEESRQLRGLAFFAFVITALSAFIAIEKIINDIWHVTARRSLRSRISSFVQLLLFGPILIAGTYSGLYFLQDQPLYQFWEQSLAVQAVIELIPFVFTTLGLTVLFWQVPNTSVRLRHAFAGGATSAGLIELLRFGFSVYVEKAKQMSVVYGSFGALLFFVISVQLSWLIVLLGTEISYSTQNFRYMSRGRRPLGAVEGSWLGLAAMVLVTDRFRAKKPITPQEVLAEKIGISVADLRKSLRPLVDAELLHENLGEEDGYLLSCDPYELRIEEVTSLYEGFQRQLLDALPDEARGTLEDLRDRYEDAREEIHGDLTLAELLGRSR